jgi:hypothetical protein
MSLSEPDAAFLAERNLTFLFARRPDGSPAGWPVLTFDLSPRAVTSASFAKLAEHPG